MDGTHLLAHSIVFQTPKITALSNGVWYFSDGWSDYVLGRRDVMLQCHQNVFFNCQDKIPGFDQFKSLKNNYYKVTNRPNASLSNEWMS